MSGSLSARQVSVGFNPLVCRMPFQSRIRWHGCLGGRQLPDGSRVTLSQQVWWHFSWQVGSLGGVSTVSFKVVLEWCWHSELMLLLSNLSTSLSANPRIKQAPEFHHLFIIRHYLSSWNRWVGSDTIKSSINFIGCWKVILFVKFWSFLL